MTDLTIEQLAFTFRSSFAGAFYMACEAHNVLNIVYPIKKDICIREDIAQFTVTLQIVFSETDAILHEVIAYLTMEAITSAIEGTDLTPLCCVELQGVIFAKEALNAVVNIIKQAKDRKGINNVIPLH